MLIVCTKKRKNSLTMAMDFLALWVLNLGVRVLFSGSGWWQAIVIFRFLKKTEDLVLAREFLFFSVLLTFSPITTKIAGKYFPHGPDVKASFSAR